LPAPLAPPRGFRDLPPELASLRNKVVDKIRVVFELYGFSPMETPAVEYWETLSGKYGEEAERMLIWKFKDPYSDRWYGLRYDLTVPLARFVASHPELPMPFKRYQVAPVWRHEEPQKMRYREFLQADVDVVGSPYPEADAEVISAVHHALEEVGLRNVVVRLNHRKLLKAIFEQELGIANPIPVYRAIDKLDKVGLEGVRKELEGLGLSPSTVEKILRLLEQKAAGADGLRALAATVGTSAALSALEELEKVVKLCYRPESVVVDLSLARGLDYYTGAVVEFSSEDAPGVSVAGGGRYDDLIGLFRPQGSLPATGCSIGVDRVVDALARRGRCFEKLCPRCCRLLRARAVLARVGGREEAQAERRADGGRPDEERGGQAKEARSRAGHPLHFDSREEGSREPALRPVREDHGRETGSHARGDRELFAQQASC